MPVVARNQVIKKRLKDGLKRIKDGLRQLKGGFSSLRGLCCSEVATDLMMMFLGLKIAVVARLVIKLNEFSKLNIFRIKMVLLFLSHTFLQ